LLRVSHTTVARWLQNTSRKHYTIDNSDNRSKKGNAISELVRAAIVNDPFLSNYTLRTIIRQTCGFYVSKELVRTVIKNRVLPKRKPAFMDIRMVWKTKRLDCYNQRTYFCVKGKGSFLSTKLHLVGTVYLNEVTLRLALLSISGVVKSHGWRHAPHSWWWSVMKEGYSSFQNKHGTPAHTTVNRLPS
jgi:hypothetical protein